MQKISTIEKILGYSFQDEKLLKQALIHPSKISKNKESLFERLEFLGDRVLGLLVAHMIYEKFPDKNEGKLSELQAFLTSRKTCTDVCIEAELDKFIEFRQEDFKSSSNQSIYANAIESILGAMFLDGGLDPCKYFITKFWEPYLNNIPETNPKGALQELTAKKGWDNPTYILKEQSGPPHNPVFTVEAIVKDKKTEATGTSRKTAEQKAAQMLCEILTS